MRKWLVLIMVLLGSCKALVPIQKRTPPVTVSHSHIAPDLLLLQLVITSHHRQTGTWPVRLPSEPVMAGDSSWFSKAFGTPDLETLDFRQTQDSLVVYYKVRKPKDGREMFLEGATIRTPKDSLQEGTLKINFEKDLLTVESDSVLFQTTSYRKKEISVKALEKVGPENGSLTFKKVNPTAYTILHETAAFKTVNSLILK